MIDDYYLPHLTIFDLFIIWCRSMSIMQNSTVSANTANTGVRYVTTTTDGIGVAKEFRFSLEFMKTWACDTHYTFMCFRGNAGHVAKDFNFAWRFDDTTGKLRNCLIFRSKKELLCSKIQI